MVLGPSVMKRACSTVSGLSGMRSLASISTSLVIAQTVTSTKTLGDILEIGVYSFIQLANDLITLMFNGNYGNSSVQSAANTANNAAGMRSLTKKGIAQRICFARELGYLSSQMRCVVCRDVIRSCLVEY